MKKQKLLLSLILTTACLLTGFLTFSDYNFGKTAEPVTKTVVVKEPIKKETSPNTSTNETAKKVIPVAEKPATPAPQPEEPATMVNEPAVPNATKAENTTTETDPAPTTEAATNELPLSGIPVQLTAEEAYASQQDPVTIDLVYQGTWRTLDNRLTIIGDQYGYKFDGAPFSWLHRFAKTDGGLILGDTNYYTFYVHVTAEDHLIIEKLDGTESYEFTRVYQ